MNIHKKRTFTPSQYLNRLAVPLGKLPGVAKILAKPSISPTLREEVILSVSRENDSRFCQWGHTQWAHLEDVDTDELQNFLETHKSDKFSEKEITAILFAQRHADQKGDLVEDAHNELSEHFTEKEIEDIIVTIQTTDMANMVSNTFDAFLARLKNEKVKGSYLVNEAASVALFCSIAPPVYSYVKLRSLGNPNTKRVQLASM